VQQGLVAADQNGYALYGSHSYSGASYSSFTRIRQYSSDFRADLGRVNQVGIRELFHSSSVSRPSKSATSLITSWSVGINYGRTEALHGATLFDQINVNGSIKTKNNTSIAIGISTRKERFEGRTFDLRTGSIFATFFPSSKLFFNVSYTRNEFINLETVEAGDSEFASLSIGYTLREFARLSLSVSNSQFELRGSSLFEIDSVNIGMNLFPSLNHSVSLIATYGDLVQTVSSNSPLLRNSSLGYQAVYKFQRSPFTSLIIGLSGSSVGEAGIESLGLVRLFGFAKLSYSF